MRPTWRRRLMDGGWERSAWSAPDGSGPVSPSSSLLPGDRGAVGRRVNIERWLAVNSLLVGAYLLASPGRRELLHGSLSAGERRADGGRVLHDALQVLDQLPGDLGASVLLP